ncbi:class I SAM-dependent methyltransferase [Actinocorallia longicatena]|uniref:Cyclopropane-fatty-acyl-phospholipid synthase family protein n=1 Tax=Actinocorallia longicatena TaxID=111803 RepID=A0ABP6Q4U3_9ACTN
MSDAGVAARLGPLLHRILGPDLPVRVRAWDGSEAGPEGAPIFVIRDRRALRRLLWKPGEVGLVRSYVAGELDIEGDVVGALAALQRVLRHGDEPIVLTSEDKREIVRTAVTLGAVGPEPKAPPEERGQGPGLLGETPVGFYERMLGPSRSFGCGLWDGAVNLEEAQAADHADLVARLGLKPGAQVLDLSAGWGVLAALLAAEGAQVTGVTAFTGSVAAGVTPVPEPGGGPYDLIVAPAGTEPVPRLAARLAVLLKPGGRLLARQLVHRQGAVRRPFTSDYVFPHEELATLGSLTETLDAAGLEVRKITARREDYARTLRAWAANLQRTWTPDDQGLSRVWLLHLATTALACELGRIGLYETEAILR